MITSFEGKMGTGKTLSATAMAYSEVQRRNMEIEALTSIRGLEDDRFTSEYSNLESNLMQTYGVNKLTADKILNSTRSLYNRNPEVELKPLTIYANYHLNFPYTRWDPDFFLERVNDPAGINDCILIMDEAYIYMDSRSSASKLVKLFGYFIGQTRKRGVKLFVCVHHRDVLDKRLRRAINIRGICRFGPKGPVEEFDRKGIPLPIPLRRYNWATANFTNVDTGLEKMIKFYGPLFWGLYDTNEVVALEKNQTSGIVV